MRIGHRGTHKQAYAVCITRTAAYACLLSGNFSEDCEDISLDDGPIFFSDLTQFLLGDFL
jgi:hypothetical protein